MNLNFTPFPELETERLILRALQISDAKAIFGLRTNKDVNTFITRDLLNNLSEARAFIDYTANLAHEATGIFWGLADKENNEIIGSIGLRNFDAEENYAEIGYDLHPNYQDRGFMNEAFLKILEFASQQMSLKTIEAFTHKNNIASIALLEKHAFKIQNERKDKGFENNKVYRFENITLS
jgi:ribosomal-protein-alanine N-acetyltransferase